VAVPGSIVERAPQELKAFKRVSVQPGETQTVRLVIPGRDLAYYNPELGWRLEPAEYVLRVGQHSLDEAALVASFHVA